MNCKRFAAALAALLFSLPLFAKNVTNGAINFDALEAGKKYVSLDGDWEFYIGQTFTSILGAQLKVDFIETPAPWTKMRMDRPQVSPIGCNTYRVLISGLRRNFEYAIFSRKSPSYSAMVYANGQFVGEYGTFSRHREDYKAAELPIFCRILSNESGLIELVVQVSNYTGGQGGITSPIFFGESSAMTALFQQAMLVTASILGLLLFAFLMNFFFWTLDKSKTANLCFSALIIFLALRQSLFNLNVSGLAGVLLPFSIQFRLENLLIFSPAIFAAMLRTDSVFTAKHPMADKMLCGWTFALFMLFLCLPENVSMLVLELAFIWAVLFALYAIYRFAAAIKNSQGLAAVYTFFYIVIAIPMAADHYLAALWTQWRLYISEIFIFTMTIADVVYVAAVLELSQKKAIALKNESSRQHISVRRFIPRSLTKFSKKNILKNLELGFKIEEPLTILSIGLEVISPDNTQVSLRDAFESMGFYSATIIDQINKRNGSVISIAEKGIFALFKADASDALEAAKEMRGLLQSINARRAEDYYPCAAFSIAIHKCDLLLGIVGDRTKVDFAVVSSGTEVAEKMRNLGFAMNIPILVSEPTVLSLDDEAKKMLKLLGRIHFSEFTRPIGLYGFISSEEEESSLQNVEEAPFITQLVADKYISY